VALSDYDAMALQQACINLGRASVPGRRLVLARKGQHAALFGGSRRCRHTGCSNRANDVSPCKDDRVVIAQSTCLNLYSLRACSAEGELTAKLEESSLEIGAPGNVEQSPWVIAPAFACQRFYDADKLVIVGEIGPRA
jgi:hypothetical protein